jgi:ribonucleoside-triphosphate reductase
MFAENGINKKGKLSQVWFNSPKETILSFLKGIFKGDGYEKGGEIHINDFSLAKDISVLYTLAGVPITFRKKENSQSIRIQHTHGRGSLQDINKNDILANRLPQFIVNTGKTKPFYNKDCLVSLSAIEKHSAHTQESLKLAQSAISTIKVEDVSFELSDEPVEFFDIELEKNHFFVHSLGSITHNCCRLQLDLRDLKQKTGGLFGSGDKTGSIGVITINMPKIGYLAKDDSDFFERLEQLMYLGKESLEIKRKEVAKNMKNGLLPWSKRYLGNLDHHFSTIGLVGMNEACVNFLGKDIASKDGKQFALKTLEFMRQRLMEFQAETGHIYNLEATPAEGTSYRLARIDKKFYPEIKSAGSGKEPYYTNSTQFPVNNTDDIFEALTHQDELQTKYTGGTVLHGFIGESLSDSEACRKLVKKIAYSFKLPYYTISPTFSICPVHGYIRGKHFACPVEGNGQAVAQKQEAKAVEQKIAAR